MNILIKMAVLAGSLFLMTGCIYPNHHHHPRRGHPGPHPHYEQGHHQPYGHGGCTPGQYNKGRC